MGETVGSVADFDSLPEGCVAKVLSLTTPGDACRFASVSPLFRRAADSDAVWERFLPPDHRTILSPAVDFDFSPAKRKKDLYLSLHRSPVLIDDGTKSFSIDKWTGKKCFMLSSRDLHISWGDTPQYWKWTSHPESRFAEVAELLSVCWLEIRGTLRTALLSPSTNYAAYFVYKITPDSFSFDDHDAELCLGFAGGDRSMRNVCLGVPWEDDQAQQDARLSEGADDDGVVIDDMGGILMWPGSYPRRGTEEGWLRVELGEFYIDDDHDNDNVLEMSVLDVINQWWKRGLIVEGIEIRPKETWMSGNERACSN